MTEKQLISKLQMLKKIEPSKDWALLVKSQILGSETVKTVTPQNSPYKKILSGFFGLMNQRNFAYAFSVMVFVFAGLMGFAQYTLPGDMLFSVKKITEQSQASLTGESDVKSNFETFKKRSQDLAQVVKDKKSLNKSSAIQEVNDAAKSLANAIHNDPKAAKEVALELKNNQTLLSLQGEESKEASDILYQAVVKPVLDDMNMNKENLTESQQELVLQANALYDEGRFMESLEKILLVNDAEIDTTVETETIE